MQKYDRVSETHYFPNDSNNHRKGLISFKEMSIKKIFDISKKMGMLFSKSIDFIYDIFCPQSFVLTTPDL